MNIRILMLTTLLMVSIFSFAQNADNPVTYMNQVEKPLSEINQKYMAYVSASSHSSVRKAEKKRAAMMDQIEKSRYALIDIPSYKGDKSLLKASMDYIKLLTDVENENYSKIVNMEDIAEQSYDNMEAYLLIKKKVNEKMEAANDTLQINQAVFAKKNNVNLINTESENSLKMKKIASVMDYQDKIYLIFFKCNVQENALVKAMDKKDITAIEQTKNSMVKYADEGLTKLDTIPAYDGDGTLKEACKQALKFFKREADQTSNVTDFFMKKEAFDQIKKAFDSNPNAKKDQKEIDKFNKAVNELNGGVNNFNQTTQSLNETRHNMYENWGNSEKTFLDTHVPYSN